MTKGELRKIVRRRMRGLEDAQRSAAGARLAARLRRLPQLLAASVVAGFWPLRSEPDLRDLLRGWRQEGKQILLPRWDAAAEQYEMVDGCDAAAIGPHGAGEPVASARRATAIELAAAVWLVPGVAFDRAGNRLGRGGGYYDRLLANCGGARIGVAFRQQLCEQVPAEFHDIRMQWIVTETETIACTRQPGRSCSGLRNEESAPWKSSLDLLLLSPVLESALWYKNQSPGTY